MDILKEHATLLIATAVAWLCVVLVSLLGIHEFIVGGAAILATLTTITIWSLWALDAYGISVDGTENTKAKRETAPAATEDARFALLMTLLTPDERDAVRQRLADSMTADGELSLAELLAAQEQESDAHHTSQRPRTRDHGFNGERT